MNAHACIPIGKERLPPQSVLSKDVKVSLLIVRWDTQAGRDRRTRGEGDPRKFSSQLA